MANPRPILVPILCALTMLSSACSQADEPRQSDAPNIEQREFSAAEREAAATLSIIANVAPANASEDPFERAVHCHAALVSLREGFGQGSALGEAQLAGLTQAEQFFARRVQDQGRALGRQPAQIEVAMREAADERSSMADEARVVLGCIRQIQQ